MIRRNVFACVLTVFAAIALTAQGRWEALGQLNVTDRADHDTLTVTRAKGGYEAIKFEVRRRGVDFHRVVIHFANGDDQRVEMRNSIAAGGESRVIDLEGRERIIRSIEFWYDARSAGRGGPAMVRVVGRH